MKLTYILPTLALTLIAFISLSTPASAQETETSCVRDSNGDIVVNPALGNFVTDNDGNVGDSCKEVPDFYRLTFYRFALCKQDPMQNGNSMASCTFLLNSDAGVQHIIQGVGTAAVLDTSSADQPVQAGSYGYIAMLLGNELSIKHTETFSTSITGRTGQGTTCWTVNSRTAFSGKLTTSDDPTLSEPNTENTSTLAMDCGAANEAAAAYTTEVFDSMDDGDQPFSARFEDDNVMLLQDDNISQATTPLNAKRILATWAQPALVTATSSFALRFTLTDSVSVDMARDDNSQEIFAIKNGADPFQVALTISN